MSRTHCRNGHDLTLPYALASGDRCRTCIREGQRARRRAARGYTPGPTVILGRKCCGRCGRWRHLVDFAPYRDTARSGKPGSYCEVCATERVREKTARIAADPVRREARRERQRFHMHAKRRAAGIPERNWTDRSRRGDGTRGRGGREVDPAPFIARLDEWRATHPGVTLETLAAAAGSAPRTIWGARTQGRRLRSGTVQAWLDAMGCPPNEFDLLYPPVQPLDQEYFDAAMPLRRVRVAQFCDFKGCGGGRGHGPREGFCEEHGEMFTRIREEFEASEGWSMDFETIDDDYDYDEEIAA